MKGNMMLFSPLCLLLFWMLPADSQGIPLNMAEDAVDDRYFGCNKEMEKMVMEKYFQKESKKEFGKEWESLRPEAALKLQKVKGVEALTENHITAILVYTLNENNMYKDLNTAVRTGKNNYGSDSFQFHFFHFWLTTAIQILSNHAECFTTYRRTNIDFTGNVKERIRLSSFSSSSFLTDQKAYGNKNCFKIKTCAGANIIEYSKHPEEKEVLIPPYEMFTISAIKKDKSVEGLKDCEVVYILESAGIHSNLNCVLHKK